MTILVIIVLTVTIVQLPAIECEHPQYSFRCLENGDIHLFGLHKDSKILSLKGDIGDCTATNVTSPKNISDYFFVIPQNCANSTIKRDYSVQIVVEDPTFDVKRTITSSNPTTPSPTTTTTTTTKTTAAAATAATTVKKRRKRSASPATTPQIIGGHNTHSFIVTCKNIPQEGVDKTVVHVFQGKEYNALSENYMEVGSVEMRFKAVNNKDSPDINTIYVGDEFFMFLEYKGSKDYFVRPKTCLAYSGTFWGTGNTNKVNLWDRNNPSCTPNEELLQSFHKTNSTKRIYAKMFGFRFSNSEYITIQCEVGIFPSIDSTKQLCGPISYGRKRRGIENVEVKTKFASSKIRVYDNKDMYQMENKSPQKSVDISVWILLVFGTLLYRC